MYNLRVKIVPVMLTSLTAPMRLLCHRKLRPRVQSPDPQHDCQVLTMRHEGFCVQPYTKIVMNEFDMIKHIIRYF